MRRVLTVAFVVIAFQTASMAMAADFSFSINVGGPPVVVSQPPDFLYPPELGFGVAVGMPYDMFYVNGVYFIFRGGGWYRTGVYGGDWVRVGYRELPPGLRRYKMSQIHAYRDREYRSFQRDRAHYGGRHFRPEGRGREEHGDMRGPGHEGRGEGRGNGREERGGEGRGHGHEDRGR
jgi:hypothetical protein